MIAVINVNTVDQQNTVWPQGCALSGHCHQQDLTDEVLTNQRETSCCPDQSEGSSVPS